MATSYKRITNKGTYNCELCGKLTRDTGAGEADINEGYCKKCYFGCLLENAFHDYGVDSEEYKQAKANYEECK